jgi:hypothetical protein
LLREKNAHEICSQWANFLWAKICSINLLTENQICSRRIMNCPLFFLQSSMDAWHDFYLHTNCSKRRKYAHSNEKLLTKIKFAQSKNLLKAEICSEFARSIEKLPTMKSLASSDGSTGRLNVSHQANRSTTGAHHTTVSVVTAGTCWAGPSWWTNLHRFQGNVADNPQMPRNNQNIFGVERWMRIVVPIELRR